MDVLLGGRGRLVRTDLLPDAPLGGARQVRAAPLLGQLPLQAGDLLRLLIPVT